MARSVNEILDQMITAKNSEPGLSQLTSNSISAIWRLMYYVIAVGHHILETLFDAHKTEITGIIDNMKPHSPLWYANMAKRFQYGFDLLPDSDQFDNTGKTDSEIEASRIVAYSAVIEQKEKLLMKVAKIENDDLAALEAEELSAFENYINRIKDAGVTIDMLTYPADELKLDVTIFYNPLVLNARGERIDGTSDTPVPDAIRAYLAGIAFDSTVVLADLVDALQRVNGVSIPHISLAAYKYGVLDWIPFDIMFRPQSGYTRIADTELNIIYVPRSVV